MEIGSWVRSELGWIRQVTDYDPARGPAGCVKTSDGAWHSLAGGLGWTVSPWVPRVGERVRVDAWGPDTVDAFCVGHDTGPLGDPLASIRRPSWDGPQWSTVAALSPVLDASGRPVVADGSAYVSAPPVTPMRTIATVAELRGQAHDTFLGKPIEIADPWAADTAAANAVLRHWAVPGSVVVVAHPGGRSVTYTGADGKAYGLVAGTAERAAAVLASAAAQRATAPPAYTPRVGDLVEWSRSGDCHWQVADEGCGTSPLIGLHARPLHNRPKVILAVPADLTPLRPTAAGQRVRHGDRTGRTLDPAPEGCDRVRVVFDHEPYYWQAMVPGALVRIADTKTDAADAGRVASIGEALDGLRDAVGTLAQRHRATPVPGNSEAAETRIQFPDGTAVEAKGVTWSPLGSSIGAYAARKWGERAFDRAVETLGPLPGSEVAAARESISQFAAMGGWAVDAYTQPSPIAARHAGHCPTCHRATRAPNEVRVHWWACGCPVEVEGVEANHGEGASARDVLVWGGGTFAEGWTLDEAEQNWRASLAQSQRGIDTREHTKPDLRTYVNPVLADVRADREARRVEREKAAMRAVEADRQGATKAGQAVYYSISYAGLPDVALDSVRGKARVLRG